MATGRSYADAATGKSRNPARPTAPLLTRCVTCAKEGIMPLTCKAKHKMCPACLSKNVAQFGSKLEDMYTCPECTKPMETAASPIWIFVDNSNIWIEAKKLASKIKGFKSVEDHRLRISIGHLTDVVANDRNVVDATLYGSEPPKIDSVWDKIRQHGWHVKTKKRSYVTHKEKEIDAQLVADVTKLACTTPPAQRGTIILISGDADMCPAVEKIMEEGCWKVEIYMWGKALSPRLKKFCETYPDRVVCEPLDNQLENVTFTNKKLQTNGVIDKKWSAVLQMKEKCFPNHVIEEKWWKQLESIAQWPVEYWWIIKDDEETDELLLVFRGPRETSTYSVSGFVKTLSDDIAAEKEEPLLPHVLKAETHIDYMKRNKVFEAIIKPGKYKYVDIERDLNFVRNSSESADMKGVEVEQEASDGGASGFQSVPPSSVGGKQKDCKYGKNCLEGKKCKYKHSQRDKTFFERHGGKGNPTRKVKMCRKFATGSCPYPTESCLFAHGEIDAWCLCCRKHGHFTSNCPN